MVRIEKNKTYLVTGGSGFLGGELIERILNVGGKVVTIARNEGQLIKLKQKYPEEMTIIIQYEFYDLEVNKNNFSITLSFNNINTNIIIGYDSVLSFADPSENFGLILQEKKIQNKIKKNLKKIKTKKSNVINFSSYKKN